jgi:hypothetical protein
VLYLANVPFFIIFKTVSDVLSKVLPKGSTFSSHDLIDVNAGFGGTRSPKQGVGKLDGIGWL